MPLGSVVVDPEKTSCSVEIHWSFMERIGPSFCVQRAATKQFYVYIKYIIAYLVFSKILQS
jgi:hypothetical protein